MPTFSFSIPTSFIWDCFHFGGWPLVMMSELHSSVLNASTSEEFILPIPSQVLSCHGPSKPQRVTSEPLLKDDQADYQPGLIVDGSLLTAASFTPSPVMMPQHSFLENNSLTSIDRSPTIGQRSPDAKETPTYSSSVPANSCYMLQPPSWMNPQVRRATTSNLPAMSAAGWNFNPLQHYPADGEDLVSEYSNRLVAPIATPETLSGESANGSVSSLAKRAHKFLRRDRAASVTKRKDLPKQYSGSSSSVHEMTESSSVYCASPLSSAKTTSGQTRATRAQLKREIMRLYQRAAADVDKIEQTPSAEQQDPSSTSSHTSRTTSSSSQSQPSRLFPVLEPASPVFGGGNGSNSDSHSGYALSPVASRPATANGATDRRLSPSSRPNLPPCNTSF